MAWSDFTWPETWLPGIKLGDHLTNPPAGSPEVVRAKRDVENDIIRSLGFDYLSKADTSNNVNVTDWFDLLQGQFASDSRLQALTEDLWGWRWVRSQVEDVSEERARSVRRRYDEALSVFIAYVPEKLRTLSTDPLRDKTEVWIV